MLRHFRRGRVCLGTRFRDSLATTFVVSFREVEMSCKSCQSERQSNLNGEIAIHSPGLKGLDKPIVWVFPKILVCLNCGFTEFTIPETELYVLRNGTGLSAVP